MVRWCCCCVSVSVVTLKCSTQRGNGTRTHLSSYMIWNIYDCLFDHWVIGPFSLLLLFSLSFSCPHFLFSYSLLSSSSLTFSFFLFFFVVVPPFTLVPSFSFSLYLLSFSPNLFGSFLLLFHSLPCAHSGVPVCVPCVFFDVLLVFLENPFYPADGSFFHGRKIPGLYFYTTILPLHRMQTCLSRNVMRFPFSRSLWIPKCSSDPF